MLSDVEEKTYEFGMLRALGFNTKNIMITIIM
jgi:ABC-type antimicrobial peptide transport system permease subunit